MRKIPFAEIELTSQRVRGLRGTSELPGRPVIFEESIVKEKYEIVNRVLDTDNHCAEGKGKKSNDQEEVTHIKPTVQNIV